MALYNSSDQTLETQRTIDTTMKDQDEGDEEEQNEEEELKKLEADVKQMAEKILHFRTTLPDQLKDAVSLLSSSTFKLQPNNPVLRVPNSGPGGSSQFGESTSSIGGDDMTAKKLKLLGEKTSRNASQVPILLKRIKDCISMMEKSNMPNCSAPPVFKEYKS